MKHNAQDPPSSRVRQVADLSRVVREARKRSGLDQAAAAGLVGVGTRFLGELERGKETLRAGLILKVLHRMGLELWIVPRGASLERNRDRG